MNITIQFNDELEFMTMKIRDKEFLFGQRNPAFNDVLSVEF
jgi:hypothetical protein